MGSNPSGLHSTVGTMECFFGELFDYSEDLMDELDNFYVPKATFHA